MRRSHLRLGFVAIPHVFVDGPEDTIILIGSSLYPTAVTPGDVQAVDGKDGDDGDVGGGVGVDVGRTINLGGGTDGEGAADGGGGTNGGGGTEGDVVTSGVAATDDGGGIENAEGLDGGGGRDSHSAVSPTAAPIAVVAAPSKHLPPTWP